ERAEGGEQGRRRRAGGEEGQVRLAQAVLLDRRAAEEASDHEREEADRAEPRRRLEAAHPLRELRHGEPGRLHAHLADEQGGEDAARLTLGGRPRGRRWDGLLLRLGGRRSGEGRRAFGERALDVVALVLDDEALGDGVGADLARERRRRGVPGRGGARRKIDLTN